MIEAARKILRHRDLRRFLGAYFLYEDGVNTVVGFSAIFAAQTLGFPMDRLIVLYIVVQVSALLGALAWARPTDRLGPKLVVMVTLFQWTAIVIAAYFVHDRRALAAQAVETEGRRTYCRRAPTSGTTSWAPLTLDPDRA